MKKIIGIIIAAIISLLIIYLTGSFNNEKTIKFNTVVEDSILRQNINTATEKSVELNKIYNGNQLIGYMEDVTLLDQLVIDMYENTYKEIYPNSSLNLDDDIFIVKENSLLIPEYDDQKIISYIVDNKLFDIQAKRIDFITDKGIYDSIYVINDNIFKEAQEEFLNIFVSAKALEAFKENKQLPELTEYGSREIGTFLLQDIVATDSYANPEEILTSKEDIVDYLCYGDLEELNYYTTLEGDTIIGVGALHNQMTPEQVVAINSDILKSPTQILEPGTVLNVTYFAPIVDVVVEKELITKEIVYPDQTIYLDDPNLREGMTRTDVEYKEGTQNSKYKETWINGQLVEGELISSEIVEKPLTPIVYVGSKIIPGVGSGSFRYPVENVYMSCGWYCYPGHRAADFQNRYNLYGNVYASDRGTVTKNSYHPTNGYYIIIDHNNGYVTQYNHLNKPAYFKAGVNVDKGEVIGQIGSTGWATGPHVHLIIWENGSRINPCKKLGC